MACVKYPWESRLYVLTLNNDARDYRIVEPNQIRGTVMSQAQAVLAQAQAPPPAPAAPQPANPLDRPLTAEERADFTAVFNRMPERFRLQLMASLEVGTVGAARDAIDAVLREGRPAAAAQAPAQGVAFEIHNAFSTMKFDRFMEILRAGIGSERNFKDREFPLMPLVRNIENNNNLIPEKKRELSGKIERIFETLSQYQNYRASLPYIMDAIQYILMQPQEVIDIYIDTLCAIVRLYLIQPITQPHFIHAKLSLTKLGDSVV